MSNLIKENFYKFLDIEITPRLCEAITRYVAAYEIKGNNLQAFNSPYLGVHKAVFTNSDRDGFFALFNTEFKSIERMVSSNVNSNSVFGVSAREMSNTAKEHEERSKVNMSDMRKLINTIPSIDTSFKITSDPLNLFLGYILHRIRVSDVKDNIKQPAMVAVGMFLQYKFFTSLVQHRFKHAPNENMMRALFESLSNKFAIRQLDTWREVMLSRARDLISDTSIHKTTLETYEPDKEVLYVITDMQTRLRNQINAFTEEYFKFKEEHEAFGDYSSVGTDSEGNKVILGDTSGLDKVIAAVYQDVQCLQRLLDERNIKLVTGLFNAVTIPMFRQLLVEFSSYVCARVRANDLDGEKKWQGTRIITGAFSIIEETIQKSYRYCIETKVNMNRPSDVLRAVKDVYSSSRVNDEGINKVKASLDKIIVETKLSSRQATNASLRIALVLYLIICTFAYLH